MTRHERFPILNLYLLQKGIRMLYTIAVILLVLWLLGFAIHIGGAFIHLLLIIAVIVIIYRLVTGRRKV